MGLAENKALVLVLGGIECIEEASVALTRDFGYALPSARWIHTIFSQRSM